MTRPSTTKALAKAMVASDTIQAGSTGAMPATARNASPAGGSGRDHMPTLPGLDLREQAMRTEHEEKRNDTVDDEELKLRNEMNRSRAAQADDDRPKKRAFDRSKTAGDDH